MRSCLIVDDSRVVRKVLKRITDEMGFNSIEAEDGQKAYDACKGGLPEVVILDWNMPVMSGIEFLEKFRALDGGDKPKVILCTTENDMGHIKRALDAGANEYIMKPFDSEIIKTKFRLIGLIE